MNLSLPKFADFFGGSSLFGLNSFPDEGRGESPGLPKTRVYEN
jgi:hypothetical protein